MSDLPYVFTPPPTSIDMQRLVQDLRDDVPGAIVSNLKSAMYRAFDEFFEFTNVWQLRVDITLVVNTRAYTLATPQQGNYNRLLNLFDSQDQNEQWVDRANFAPPNVINIYTTPSQTATWVAQMAMKLANIDINGYPDAPEWIIQKYRDALYDGTRRMLHLEPGKPFSDLATGMLYGKKFIQGKSQARMDTIKGNVYGQTNWSYPRGPFTRGSQRS